MSAVVPDDAVNVARTLDGAEYRVGPIRPDDAARERAFIVGLSAESSHNRFMCALREPSPALIEQFVNVDRHDTMALEAVIGAGQTEQIIGVARYAADCSGRECEFAVTVADAWQSRGIGSQLTLALFEHARCAGFSRVYGHVLADNDRMMKLARLLGLEMRRLRDNPSLMEASRSLET